MRERPLTRPSEPSASGPPQIDVRDRPERARFEITLNEQRAGFAEYDLRDGEIVFTHTEVDEAFEGHGLGSRLARAALDDARARGLRVRPVCRFIASYIRRHPEYRDMVALPEGEEGAEG